jgi:hypothetical protein
MDMNMKLIEVCPCCDGDCEVVKPGIYTGNPFERPMVRCAYCDGSGEVSMDMLETFDPDVDYVSEHKAGALDAKIDAKIDARRMGSE